MEVNFRAASINEVVALAPFIRQSDRQEVERLGQSIEEGLEQSARDSDHFWIFYMDDKPAAVIGIGTVSIMGNMGCPWFLTTDLMETMAAKRALLKYSPIFVHDFLQLYDNLVNYVDVRYVRALRWLRWLGFEIEQPQPAPLTGELFCRVSMRRK